MSWIGVWELILRGGRGIITRICQNELTNHTHVTVLEPTAFVPVYLLRPAAKF